MRATDIALLCCALLARPLRLALILRFVSSLLCLVILFILLIHYTYINIGKTERIIKISKFLSNSVENFEDDKALGLKTYPFSLRKAL